jgi:branched-chain amino acid transport system permease protein
MVLNALALGMAYALVALGFVLALNASGAVNFAHGGLVVLGGVAAVLADVWTGLPGPLLLPLVMFALGVAGIVTAKVAILPLLRRPPEATFVATIALAAIIEQSLLLALGNAPRTAPPLAGSGSVEIAGLSVGRQPLAIVIVSALLIAVIWFLLERTQVGRRMRAVAADRYAARATGIPVDRYVVLSLALAGALAGVAGQLLGHQFLVVPTEGGGHMLRAYIAVALGGWGSIPGAMLGALGIGVFETLVSSWLGDAWASAALYVAVLAVLSLRSQGLFGEPVGRRA